MPSSDLPALEQKRDCQEQSSSLPRHGVDLQEHESGVISRLVVWVVRLFLYVDVEFHLPFWKRATHSWVENQIFFQDLYDLPEKRKRPVPSNRPDSSVRKDGDGIGHRTSVLREIIVRCVRRIGRYFESDGGKRLEGEFEYHLVLPGYPEPGHRIGDYAKIVDAATREIGRFHSGSVQLVDGDYEGCQPRSVKSSRRNGYGTEVDQ